jgi:hypothetical protein
MVEIIGVKKGDLHFFRKEEEKNNQLCNKSYGKLEEISFKSPSLVSLPLICRIIRRFISVHADFAPPENASQRLALISQENLLSLIE